MILTLTATRQGLSPKQQEMLPGLFAALPAVLVHGGTVGGDEQVDAFLAPLFARQYAREALKPIEVAPAWGQIDRRSYWLYDAHYCHLRAVAWPDEPLSRNRTMVRRGERLPAFPATEEEELRSGTWATVRFARKLRRPITVVTPSERVIEK